MKIVKHKKEEQSPMVGIQIGASAEAIAETRAAIMDILRASVDESTKVVALETLTKVCSVNNANVHDCTLMMGKEK